MVHLAGPRASPYRSGRVAATDPLDPTSPRDAADERDKRDPREARVQRHRLRHRLPRPRRLRNHHPVPPSLRGVDGRNRRDCRHSLRVLLRDAARRDAHPRPHLGSLRATAGHPPLARGERRVDDPLRGREPPAPPRAPLHVTHHGGRHGGQHRRLPGPRSRTSRRGATAPREWDESGRASASAWSSDLSSAPGRASSASRFPLSPRPPSPLSIWSPRSS